MRVLFLLCLATLVQISAASARSTTVTQEQASGLFSQANAAYQAGKIDEAAEQYRSLVGSGYDDAMVLFNLGTAEARLGNRGLATAYLLKAAEKAPRNADIRFNLRKVQLADTAQETEADAEPVLFRGDPWSRVAYYFTFGEWVLALWLALTLTAFSILLLVTLKAAPRYAGILRTVIWAGAGASLLLLVPVLYRGYQRSLHQAIAVQEATLHSGPSDRYTENGKLAEGDVVKTRTRDLDGYSQVELATGQVGYVLEGSLMGL